MRITEIPDSFTKIKLEPNLIYIQRMYPDILKHFVLAGGYFLNSENSQSDIDLFCIHNDELVIKELAKFDLIKSDYIFNDNMKVFQAPGVKKPVQLIFSNYKTVSDIFKDFDFHVCQEAYYDGSMFWTDEHYYSLDTGLLTLNIEKIAETIDKIGINYFIQRLIKYVEVKKFKLKAYELHKLLLYLKKDHRELLLAHLDYLTLDTFRGDTLKEIKLLLNFQNL